MGSSLLLVNGDAVTFPIRSQDEPYSLRYRGRIYRVPAGCQVEISDTDQVMFVSELGRDFPPDEESTPH